MPRDNEQYAIKQEIAIANLSQDRAVTVSINVHTGTGRENVNLRQWKKNPDGSMVPSTNGFVFSKESGPETVSALQALLPYVLQAIQIMSPAPAPQATQNRGAVPQGQWSGFQPVQIGNPAPIPQPQPMQPMQPQQPVPQQNWQYPQTQVVGGQPQQPQQGQQPQPQQGQGQNQQFRRWGA